MSNKNINTFVAILFFISCGVEDIDEDSAIYISEPQFNFHQDVNKLFFAVDVVKEYESYDFYFFNYNNKNKNQNKTGRQAGRKKTADEKYTL